MLDIHMRGDFAVVRGFRATNHDKSFEAGVSFDFVDGRLDREWEVVDVTVSCKLAKPLWW
jgi:hypothetical protein